MSSSTNVFPRFLEENRVTAVTFPFPVDRHIYCKQGTFYNSFDLFPKTFPTPPNDVELKQRVEPLHIKRVSSIFNTSNSQSSDTANDKKERQENIDSSVDLTSTEGYQYAKEKVGTLPMK